MVEYRKAEITDIDELVRLRINFIYEIQKIDSEKRLLELKEYLYKYFEKNINDGNFVAWIALLDNKIIATSGLCFYTIPPSYRNMSGKIAYIMNMYTVPEYRKRGIAHKLFEMIVDEAKGRGYKKISLHATEMGRPIYLKYGFKAYDDELIYIVD